MKKLLRRIELPLSRLKKKKKKIEKGLVPVLVGEEGKELKRLEVPISCLSSKEFRKLLEEYQDHIMGVREGPIQLPCSLDLFHKVLLTISTDVKDHNNAKQRMALAFTCLALKD